MHNDGDPRRIAAQRSAGNESVAAVRTAARRGAVSDARTPAARAAAVRRAYFTAGVHRSMWNACVDRLVERSNAAGVPWPEAPELWISDLALACACCDGEAQAWAELGCRHVGPLCEAAELRLSPQQARLLVERFLRELRLASAAQLACAGSASQGGRPGPTVAFTAEPPRIQDYAGGMTLGRWLLPHILARIEDLPLGAPLRAPPRGSAQPALAGPRERCADVRETEAVLDSAPWTRTLAPGASACVRVPQAT